MSANLYDAVLVVSFGGPEGLDDVRPYLDRVLRGRNVPAERIEEVAHHYKTFGGVSPINRQNRDLIAALKAELTVHGVDLPIYFGNRNWHPLLADTLRAMARDGIQSALAFVTAGFSCYSGCRQYRENIEEARIEAGPGAPSIDKIRVFYNHPDFIEANCDHIRDALARLPEAGRAEAQVLFTAHSIPMSMARGSDYEQQLEESCRLVADRLGRSDWRLVYQSRSGPPRQPWLEPDICDVLREMGGRGIKYVVVSPIGFVTDHIEVVYDLDTEAREVCEEVGITFARAKTPGTHPRFVSMVGELIRERLDGSGKRRALGRYGPSHDICPPGCCSYEPAAARPAH